MKNYLARYEVIQTQNGYIVRQQGFSDIGQWIAITPEQVGVIIGEQTEASAPKCENCAKSGA